ncbi:MAG: dolichyl-diphosphooligosaccharide--protein glycosyltransferase subunit STT3, partial [Nanoarchaeota archaeon]|nr:dolichyl-diphosphooligosaccharide--protein glycosyltransferase subunit STT3 [Nanoarchaeota archaeon]
MDKEEKNDEITIDFSKVKGFFKKKKENKENIIHKKTEPEETEVKEKQDERIEIGESKKIKDKKPEETKEDIKKDDEVTIDFGKIKGFFKKKNEASDKTSDEETINIGGIFESFNKNKKFLIPLIIILICMSFSIYFRTQSAYLPVTDDWARSSIYNQYKSQISSQINQQNPFLPEANKNEIVEKEFNNLLKTQKAEIEANIVQLSNYFKSKLQDDSGQTYLVAIDPYFWYRNARNYLDHGFAGDIEIDGNYYSTHRMAPFMEEDIVKTSNIFGGWWGKKFGNLNVLIEVWLYRLVHLFNENISLMAVCFYVPVIISSLAVIPAFFIAKRVSGNVGGFFAGLMVAIHPF